MAEVSAVRASVLQQQILAITKNMATVLIRSSRSPIFSELGDLVAVLFDAKGRTLAQAEFAAIIAFGAQPGLKHIIEFFGDDIAEGDVIVHNDVFSGGNQNADLGIYVPIFAEGELVAWVACKGHMADIGGATVGGYDPRVREIWQEALRVPGVKLYDAGELRRDVWAMLAANVRLDVVMHDIHAMVGACRIGSQAFLEVLGRHGKDSVFQNLELMLEGSNRQVRDELLRWPDGTYHGESWMVSDGVDPECRYRIAVEIRIENDRIRFDFTETADQAPGFTNMPRAATLGAVRIAFLMLLAAGGVSVPTNDGLFGSVDVVLREGSLLDPVFPAATVFGNQMCDQIVTAVMSALAEALPDRVTAGWTPHLSAVLHGRDPRSTGGASAGFVALTAFQRTGGGAMFGYNGWDAIGFTGTAGQMKAIDPEMFELTSPHFVEYHELRPDSAGAGEWRGGYGTRTAWRCYGEGERGVTIGDGLAAEDAVLAAGLKGGLPGAANTMELELPDGARRHWGSKELVELPVGTRVLSRRGGGGGYGDPHSRPLAAVVAEVRDGLLTRSAALEFYGVVTDGEHGERIDDPTRQTVLETPR